MTRKLERRFYYSAVETILTNHRETVKVGREERARECVLARKVAFQALLSSIATPP